MLHGPHGRPTPWTRLRRLADPLKQSLSIVLTVSLLVGDASIPWRSASAYQAAPLAAAFQDGGSGSGRDRDVPQMTEGNPLPEAVAQPASQVAETAGPGPSAPVVHPPATSATTKHEFGTTTRNPDGSYTARLSLRPAHWRDPDTGEWRDFDNTLREIPTERGRPGFSHENTANAFRTSFARPDHAAAGGPLVRVEHVGGGVGMALVGARPGSAQVQGAQITYHGAFPGVDARYTVDGDRLKEDIILHTPAAVQALSQRKEGLSFAFDLTLEGLTAVPQPDGTITLADASGKLSLVIPRPFMVDSSGKPAGYSNDVAVELTTNSDGTARVGLTPSLAWLESPNRVYPVTLDPSLVTTRFGGPEATAKDAFISDAYPGANFGQSDALWAGTNYNRPCGSDECDYIRTYYQAFLQFPLLDALPRDSIISSATMKLRAIQGSAARTIFAHRVAEDWNENTISWNNDPLVGGFVALSSDPGGNGALVTFDLRLRSATGWQDWIRTMVWSWSTPTPTMLPTAPTGCTSPATTAPEMHPPWR